MKQSKFLSLGWRDFLRGLIIAILTPVLVIIQQSLDTGGLIFNWQTIGYSAIAGGVAYLLKNILTSPDSKPNILAESTTPIVGDRPKDRD